MCLVAFQKNFWKIFSGVWKRRRKTQIQKNTSYNPEKNHQRSRYTSHNPEKNHQRSRSEIAISPAWSREGEIVINVAISPVRSREGEIAINGAISRNVDRGRRTGASEISSDWSSDWSSPLAHARSLSLSLFLSLFPEILWSENEGRNSFPWSNWKFRSTDFNFRKIEFSGPTKQPHFRKSISGNDFHPKQTQPKLLFWVWNRTLTMPGSLDHILWIN